MPEPNLHRNNAAEWVMVALLYPMYLVRRLVAFVSSRLGGRRHG
jgi:hypothetical protein